MSSAAPAPKKKAATRRRGFQLIRDAPSRPGFDYQSL
jgi:hypothetical protein